MLTSVKQLTPLSGLLEGKVEKHAMEITSAHKFVLQKLK